jgi:hypothetical protein
VYAILEPRKRAALKEALVEAYQAHGQQLQKLIMARLPAVALQGGGAEGVAAAGGGEAGSGRQAGGGAAPGDGQAAAAPLQGRLEQLGSQLEAVLAELQAARQQLPPAAAAPAEQRAAPAGGRGAASAGDADDGQQAAPAAAGTGVQQLRGHERLQQRVVGWWRRVRRQWAAEGRASLGGVEIAALTAGGAVVGAGTAVLVMLLAGRR